MTYPPAARQFIREVTETRPDAKAEPSGKPDGFGRIRAVHFDKDTAKWLVPIIDILEDARIDSAGVGRKGLVVEFVPDVRADFADPFNIAAVDAVLNGSED